MLVAHEVGRVQQARRRVVAVAGAGAQHRAADVADAVTDLEIAHTGADFLHHTGRFGAQARRQADRVHARADIDVLKIEADGGVPDGHFALRGFGQIHLHDCQNFGAAGGVKLD